MFKSSPFILLENRHDPQYLLVFGKDMERGQSGRVIGGDIKDASGRLKICAKSRDGRINQLRRILIQMMETIIQKIPAPVRSSLPLCQPNKKVIPDKPAKMAAMNEHPQGIGMLVPFDPAVTLAALILLTGHAEAIIHRYSQALEAIPSVDEGTFAATDLPKG